MLDLIKTGDVSFPKTATKEHKAVILASKDKKLREYTSDELVAAITTLIHRAKNITGQVGASDYVMSEAVRVIVKKIKLGKGSLTLKQLELTIERGSTGEYGEFMGINGLTIIKWIGMYFENQKKYLAEQSKYEIKKKFDEAEKVESKHFKENQTDYLVKRLKYEYSRLIDNDNYIVHDLNNYFYIHLQGLGKIPIEHPRRKDFMKKADNILKKELRGDLLRAGGTQKTIIQNWITNLSKTLEGKPKMKAKYYGIVQGLILNDYLKNCCEVGLEFDEII